jgi:hypothetical protein
MNNETQTIKTSPRDFFMYLLVIVALYVNVFNFLRLLFELIDIAFPDPLELYGRQGSGVRWAIALLIIVYPAFLWASRFLQRDLKNNPEKINLKIRKWLLYLTLFVTALVIIGDLVALIFNFLEGDLTVRFLLKILAVLVTAGAVFWFYFYDLKRDPSTFSQGAKSFVWLASAVVLASVITGLFVAGSPFKQRSVRFDERKVWDLQSIQSQAVNYWSAKGKLPESLDDLRDPISSFVSPKDPQSQENYVYRKTGDLAFELCAVFNLSSAEAQIGKSNVPIRSEFGINENWQHDSGEFCFDRTIDPEIYKDRLAPLRLPTGL